MPNRFSVGLLVSVFIALLTTLVVGPLWQSEGLPASTGDVQVHLHRSAAIERGFRYGVYWPRWFPEVYNDLGAPVFHHYSPGFHWLVAAAHRIGFRLDDALKLVVTAAFALSGFGIYGWLRPAFSPAACLAAASIYVLHPVILPRTVYFAGDFPQMLAILILPVCLWAFATLHARASPYSWLAAVSSLAALVLSHNLMAVAGAVVLFAFWLMTFVGYRRPVSSLRCAGAALTAALLTAGFWLPAVADLSLVQFANAGKRLAHFSEYFLQWWQLTGVQSPILDSRAGNPVMPIDTFGLASWLALTAGLTGALFGRSKEQRRWGMAGGLFALGMLAMASPLSAFLWESWKGLSVFQYPSRFLLLAPIGAAVTAATATDAWGKNRIWLPALALVISSFLIVFPYLFPEHTPMFSAFSPVKSLSPAETRSHEPRMNAWGMTSFNEFLVQGADLRTVKGEIAEPPATRPTWRSPHQPTAELSGQPKETLLRLHFHPAWSAGRQATLSRGVVGWTQVTDLRDSSQSLEIHWAGTAWQRRGEWMSLLGLLTTLAGLLFLVFRGQNDNEGVNELPNSSATMVATLVVFATLFVAVRFTLSWSANGPFLRHSLPGELALAAKGEPATLGGSGTDRVTLLGWEILNGETPRPGGTINVRLYWQAHDQVGEDYHSFLHLYKPSLQRSWAVENIGVLRPPTRVWNPEKYYIETMRLNIPVDIPPLSYALVTGLVSSSGERLAVPGSENNSLRLREIAVRPLRPGLMQRVRPTMEASADTEDGLRLQGYDLFDGPSGYSFRLFWDTDKGVSRDWITYIHMTDSQGELVAQFDGPPLAGLQPTSQWKPDSLYIDSRKLELPDGLASGEYLLRVGLYSFESGERLPFLPDDPEHHQFDDGQLLGPVSIFAEESCYVCSRALC